MSLRKQDQRAVRWSRQCAVVASAPALLARIDGVAYRIPAAAVTADWLLEDVLPVPAGAERQSRDDLLRLRRAIPSVANARRLEESAASGVPALKRWRGVDLAPLLSAAEAYADRLSWAIGDRPTEPRPVEVLASETGDGSRLGWWDQGPLRSRVIDRDITVADRLLDVGGHALARRWLESARYCWWPQPELERLLTALARQVEFANDAAEREAITGQGEEALRPALGRGAYSRLREAARTRGGLLAELGACFDQLADDGRDADRLPALLLLLATRESDFAIPAGTESSSLHAVARLTCSASPRWVAALAEDVPEWLRSNTQPEAWLAEQSPAVAAAAARQWPVPRPASGWARDGRALRRYLLRLDEAGPPGGVGGTWLRQPWVVELVSSPLAESALALMAAAGRAQPGGEDAASALVAGLSAGNSRVRRELRAWARPVARDIDVDSFASATGLDASIVVGYLHYRRLAGDGEQLPRDAKRLTEDNGPHDQIAVLEQRLSDAALEPSRRSMLERRLIGLRDPAIREAQRDAMRRRVRNQLLRATADYRVRALRAVLERAARERLPQLRDDVPLSLLADLTWLADDDRVSPELLDRFITLALGDGSRYDWPENRRWIELQRGAFDVDHWIAGFDETTQVGGQRVRYVTEHDPVRAVHMGTWFGTCLALDGDGFNRFAALGNAVEANRHVVYATDQHGRIIARKLLAVSSSRALLGYRTYAFEDQDEHRQALDAICSRFAAACGLSRAAVGGPARILDDPLWYDDGVERWLDQEGADEPSPPIKRDLISDEDIRAWHLPCDPEVYHGLWLDGRLSQRQRVQLLQQEAETTDPGTGVGEIALFDPDGFRDAALRCGASAERMSCLELRPDRRLIEAATRIVGDLRPALHLLLPAERAIAYLRDVSWWTPSTLLLDVLRLRGVPGRRLAAAADASLRRFGDWYLTSSGEERDLRRIADRVHIEATDEKRLRAKLLSMDSAGAAAQELVRRGSVSCAAAIAAAGARNPSDEILALAGAATGTIGDWASGRVVSSSADVALLRIAAAATLPPTALRGAQDAVRADVGHPDVPPGDDALGPRWAATRDLPLAILDCKDGDWSHMRRLLADWPHLVLDDRFQQLIASAIVGPDEPLVDCAMALAAAADATGGYGPDSGMLEVLSEAAARRALSGQTARAVCAGAVTMYRREGYGWPGLLATLSEWLPAAERLRLLSVGDRGDEPSWPVLRWLLASEVRAEPTLLDAAAGLEPLSIVNLILALMDTLPNPEVELAVARLLESSSTSARAAALSLVGDLEPGYAYSREAQRIVTAWARAAKG